MLVATPYRERDFQGPRIISEIRKTCTILPVVPSNRPKLTGDLLVKCGNGVWWPRKVQIRNGQLHLSTRNKEGLPLQTARLPLRHLSLKAGPLPHSLALCRGQNVVLTLQTANEELFDLWVKSIAIELLRQTPLEAVKYLDILTLTKCWQPKKDWNSNCLNTENQCEICLKQTENPETIEDEDEKRVEDLLKKCQNTEQYVPVREKLVLFESLCKLGRKVKSTEDVSCNRIRNEIITTKRARSMHDLSNLNTQIAVREICKYFEEKCERNIPIRQNQRFLDSQLHSVPVR